jgi:HlyD family secretion protein
LALARANAEQVAMRRNQVQTSQHQLAAATSQRAKADVRLGFARVVSPIDGVVDVQPAREGEILTTGQTIFTLINPDDLWVRADVEETYIDQVKIGDTLTVRLPSGEERTATVYYRRVDASYATQRDVSRTKRDVKTFETRLRIDNKDRHLAVGMTVYVMLPLKQA